MRTIDAADGRRADQLTLRGPTSACVLRRLRDHGPRSRARLAAELGLTRTAVSTLVAELAERGLVRAGGVERGARGPPGHQRSSSTAARSAASAPRSTSTTSRRSPSTSAATVVAEHRLALDAHAARRRRGARPARRADRADRRRPRAPRRRAGRPHRRRRRAASTATRDVLTLGPNLGWRDVPVGDLLRDRLGDRRTRSRSTTRATSPRSPRRRPATRDRQDILVIFGEVGVGGGIVADGRLLRGRQGYAGEFGHMIVEPQRPTLRLRPGRLLGDRESACARCSTPPPTRTTRCATRRSASTTGSPSSTGAPTLGDTRTLAALEQVGGWVGVGRRASWPTRSTRRRSCSAATSPRSAQHMRPRDRGPAAGRRARAGRRRHPGRAVDARLHRRRPRRRAARPRDRLRRPDPGRAPRPSAGRHRRSHRR